MSDASTRLIDAVYSVAVIPALRVGASLSRLVSPKGRKRFSYRYIGGNARDQRSIWFHAASMGEYEQLVPIISALKQQASEFRTVVTLFSPSGIEHVRRNPDVDMACILPPDTRSSISRFIRDQHVRMLVIDRYDVWRNCILACQQLGVRTALVNATTPSAASNSSLRRWITDTYQRIDYISAVASDDAAGIAELIGKDIATLPDTRIDRILERVAHPESALTSLRRSDVTTLILGSCWSADEDLIIDAFHALDDKSKQSLRLVFVPHEPTDDTLQRIEKRISCTRLSTMQNNVAPTMQNDAASLSTAHILVDSVGKLLSLYSIGDAAFIGGGFGAGVHSVTEPACYGLPLSCGPYIERSRDAVDLNRSSLMNVVRTQRDLENWIHDLVLNDQRRAQRGMQIRERMLSQAGSTAIITQQLLALLSVHHT